MSVIAAGSSSGRSLHLDAFRWRSALSQEDLAGERCSALASAPNLAFIGCESGTILCCALMQAQPGAAPHAAASRLLGKRKMGKKAIQQLEVVYVRDRQAGVPSGNGTNSSSSTPTRAMLLALVESKLLLLDAQSLATVVEIAPKESFAHFCVDQASSSPSSSSTALTPNAPRICAAVKGKKKLQLFALTMTSSSGTAPSGKAELIKELQVPDTVLAMVAQGDTLAIGYKREYSLLSLSSDAPTDVPVPVEGISPLMVRCASNELLLATNNSLGFFVSFEGEPLPKAPIVWGQPPVAFSSCGGYVLAAVLEPSGTPKDAPTVSVTVASLMDQKQVQSVRLPTRISASTPPSLLLASHAQAETVLVSVSSSHGCDVFAFAQTSMGEQIEQYMDAGLALEAAQLFKHTDPPPSAAAAAEFAYRAGFISLRELDFTSAFETFFPTSHVDPRELIALFPDLTLKAMPYAIAADSQTAKLGSITSIVDAARARMTKDKGGEAAAGGVARRRKEMLELGSAAVIRQARVALACFLWKWRQEQAPLVSSSGASSQVPAGDVEIGVCVDTALLILAVEYESTSADPSSSASSRVTDSSIAAFPYTLPQLFFPANSCLMHESELVLSRERYYAALAMLFQSKGSLRKALEVWKNLGEGRFKAKDAPVAPKGAAAVVTGLAETVKLLSALTDQPLLWEFAEWVLTVNPAEGLRIFLTSRDAAAGSGGGSSSSSSSRLPPEKVLAFLKRVALNTKAQANTAQHGGLDGEYALLATPGSAAPAAGQQIDLVEAYLEYLITVEKTQEAKYHTQLALCYMGKVVKLGLPMVPRAASGTTTTRFKPGHEPAMRGPPRLKLMRFLQRSTEYDAGVVLHHLVELSAKASLDFDSSVGRSRAGSTQPLTWTGPPTAASPGARPSYSGLDPAKHESNLYEELLLLLSRLEKHTRVLQIYLFDLRDETGAAAYAHYICRRAEKEQSERRDAEQRAAAQASLDVSDDAPVSVAPSPNAAAERHPGDVFLDLLEIYFSDEYATLWHERHEAGTDTAGAKSTSAGGHSKTKSKSLPKPTDAAMDLLNDFFPLMDTVSLLRILPPTLPLAELSHLFSRLFPSTLHARRHGRLVSGMHKMVHLRTQAHCFLLRSISLALDTTTKCSWCYKALNDAVFVAHPVHAMRDPLTNSFVIDFEQGGITAAAAMHDPFHEQAGFKSELPRFVLVHYQCSPSFLANGGVDSFVNGGSAGGALATTQEPRSRGASLNAGGNGNTAFGGAASGTGAINYRTSRA